jgi:hypothetical protein
MLSFSRLTCRLASCTLRFIFQLPTMRVRFIILMAIVPYFLFSSASTPGSFLPLISSRLAPPPVDT